MKKKYRYLFGFSIFLITLIFFIGLLYYFNPSKIVNSLGLTNVYLIILILGLIAGFSSLFSSPFYASVIAVAGSDVNFFIIALIGGISLSIGHSIYYYFGSVGEKSLPKKIRKKLKKYSKYICGKDYLVPFIAFIYFSFTPFPNEFIITPLGVLNYSYKKLIPLLILGNIVLIYLTVVLSSLGF